MKMDTVLLRNAMIVHDPRGVLIGRHLQIR